MLPDKAKESHVRVLLVRDMLEDLTSLLLLFLPTHEPYNVDVEK
jgi:hypothetical protein